MSPSDARCPKDGAVLEVVEAVSTSSNAGLLCPECGSRYMVVTTMSAADNDVLYQTWDSSWGETGDASA